MSASYTSIPARRSTHTTAATVRTVFRCVASRNRWSDNGCETPTEKVRPVAHPPEALCAWATRPAMQSIAKLTRPLSEKFVLGRAPRRPPMAVAALRGRAMQSIATSSEKLLSPGLSRDLTMTSDRPIPMRLPKKLFRPTVIARAPWEIIPDKLTVYRFAFLLRRGARVPSGTRTGLCLP